MRRMTAYLQSKMIKMKNYEIIRELRKTFFDEKKTPASIREEEKHHLGIMSVPRF